MNYIGHQLIVLLITSLFSPSVAFLQDNVVFDLGCEINKVYPSLSMPRASLDKAVVISDINPHYKSSWVKTFTSVEVKASHNGKQVSAVSDNDTFTKRQLEIMRASDYQSDIAIKVLYIPDNNLKHNDIQEFSFTYRLDPEQEAQFEGGSDELNLYLKANTLDLISPTKFMEHNLSAVQFTIDEEGHIVNPQVVQSSKDPEVDKQLLAAVCNMPNWIPAAYGDGTKLKEDYILSIGDHKSCTLNLLNIRRLYLGDE